MPFAVHHLPISALMLSVVFFVASALLLGAASCFSVSEPEKTITATVTGVVYGGAPTVDRDGRSEQLALLNVQVAPLQDENPDIECRGDQAAGFLGDLLPAGSVITLELDPYVVDVAGVMPAGVRGPDGRLVNAGVAEAGWGIAAEGGSSAFYLDEIRAAQETAMINQAGFYSAYTSYTVPGQMRSVLAEMYCRAPRQLKLRSRKLELLQQYRC